jgi:hypothetical protein
MLQGRRHYYTYEITLNNLNSIVTNLGDRSSLNSYYAQWVVLLHDKHIPTVDEVMSSIFRSSMMYWTHPDDKNRLRNYVCGLDQIERAAVIYTGDLWTFRNYNQDYIREFLRKFTIKITNGPSRTVDELRNINDEILNYVHHRFSTDIVDLGVDYNTYPEHLVTHMCNTALHVMDVLAEYFDMLLTLFANPNLPPVVYDIYHMLRDSVLMSDTDSGANTLQDWVQWYAGSLKVTEDSISIANALVYLNGRVSKIYIKYVGRNINMNLDRLDDNVIEFKNEFTWIVFGLMSIAKHYFAGVNVREGSVFKRKLEIKGGSLRSNSIPGSVKSVIHDKVMTYILDEIEQRGGISLYATIRMVIQLELDIYDDIHNGGHSYLRKLSIHDASAYKITDPKKNSYQHCVMWNKVFGPSTGYTAVPSYIAYKYPTILKNKSSIKTWLSNIKDDNIRTAMAKWLTEHKKSALNIIYLPSEYVMSYPIPDEVKLIIDAKKIVLDLTNMAYITLESLAYYKPIGLCLYEIFPDITKQVREEQNNMS